MIPTDVFTSTHVIGNSCPVQIAIGVDPLPGIVNVDVFTSFIKLSNIVIKFITKVFKRAFMN